MLLDLKKSNIQMKLTFQLAQQLKDEPERISLAQALTLNDAKPRMGLKGKYGLYGSQEWWNNIEQRKAPLKFISGVITRVYIAGQDEQLINSFDLLLDDGSIHNNSIYANHKRDRKLFKIGHRVDIVFILDELKRQPAEDGGVNCSEIVLEMAISAEPVTKS